MKKRVVTAALLIALMLTSACRDKLFLPRMSEISNLEIVQIMGIDSINGEVVVTLMVNRGTSSGEDGWSGDTSTGIASFTGATVYEAISKMNVYSDRRLHLGYIDFLIIGEEAARDDITKYLDFLGRDEETRYAMQVYLAREVTAKDFLTKTASKSRSTVDMFANIEETISDMNNTRTLKLIEILYSLATPQTAAVIPALGLEDADVTFPIGGEKPEKTFAPAGFGIIVEHRLVGYFDTELARAYNYLTGQVHAVPISVEGPDGQRVAAQASTEKLMFEPEWDGDMLKSVEYSVLVGATIAEQAGRADIFNEDALQELEKQIAALARTELEQVIREAQEAGHDSLGMGDRLRMKNPLKWSKISNSWGELFSKLDIKVEVECRIHRSPDMSEGIGIEKGTKQGGNNG